MGTSPCGSSWRLIAGGVQGELQAASYCRPPECLASLAALVRTASSDLCLVGPKGVAHVSQRLTAGTVLRTRTLGVRAALIQGQSDVASAYQQHADQ